VAYGLLGSSLGWLVWDRTGRLGDTVPVVLLGLLMTLVGAGVALRWRCPQAGWVVGAVRVLGAADVALLAAYAVVMAAADGLGNALGLALLPFRP
jgi:hypothetical protein